jgi:hypothetical protein
MGKSKAQKPAKINTENVLAVLQSLTRKTQKHLGGFDLPEYLYQQIFWRRHMVILKSPECWETGACKVCGCEIIGKTMEDRACENDPACYPAMMKKEEWEQYKKDNNIKLFD